MIVLYCISSEHQDNPQNNNETLSQFILCVVRRIEKERKNKVEEKSTYVMWT